MKTLRKEIETINGGGIFSTQEDHEGYQAMGKSNKMISFRRYYISAIPLVFVSCAAFTVLGYYIGRELLGSGPRGSEEKYLEEDTGNFKKKNFYDDREAYYEQQKKADIAGPIIGFFSSLAITSSIVGLSYCYLVKRPLITNLDAAPAIGGATQAHDAL